MLLGMQELELIQLLNVTDGEHQNAMQTAIRAIREHGVKMPESFWEYKPPEPKMSQLIMFYMWTLLLPYWKFAVFAWSYRWEHYVVLVPVLLHCFLATFYDTHFFLDLFIRGKRMRLWQTFKLTYTFQFLGRRGTGDVSELADRLVVVGNRLARDAGGQAV
nr:hypothetical protein BaRGS_022223 [Batillaria attramentaria]